MEKVRRICLDFYKQYEPAMIQRYNNSSPLLQNEFDEELGLKCVNDYEFPDTDIIEFEIVDPKLFMLAQIKYGF
jgi:hypothetical protein